MVVAEPRLLEREGVLARVEERLARACVGQGGLVVFEGPAGIGKTHLLGAVRKLAASRGMKVLSAMGDRLERDYAYGVVRQLFEPDLLSFDPKEREQLLSGAAALAAEPVGFGMTPNNLAPGTLTPPEADTSFPTMHGLYWLCANLALQQPLVVCVDDAHWADTASLRFVSYLARRVDELSVLCVVASSHEEPATQPLLIQMASGPFAEAMHLASLSKVAVSSLLRSALGEEVDETFCEACHQATGGNPFLLHELVTSLKANGLPPTAANAPIVSSLGPAAVSRAVLVRLSHLGSGAIRLARAMAVLGPDTGLRHAATLADVDLAGAREAADALVLHDVLEPDLHFVHPIVQTSIYSSLLPAERASKHARAGRMLWQEGAAPERVAAHLLQAEATGEVWVVEALRDAARRDVGRGSPECAVDYLRRALDEPPPPAERGAVLSELGWAEARSGQPEGLEHLRRGLDLAVDPQTRLERARPLAKVLMIAGRIVEAVEVLEEAIASLPANDPQLRLATEADLISIAVTDAAMFKRAAERLGPLRDLVHGDSPAERVLLGVIAVVTMMRGGPADEAADLAARALAGSLLIREQTSDGLAVQQAAYILGAADRIPPGLAVMEDALADAQRRGSLLGFALTSAMRSVLQYHRGAVADAEADASNALAALSWDRWLVLPIAVAVYVDVLVDKGELVTATALLEEHEFDASLPETVPLQFLLYSRGKLRLSQGDIPGALADFRELERRRQDGHLTPFGISGTSLALLAAGERDQAQAEADRNLARAVDWGAPSAVGMALRTSGVVEGGARGLDRLREAVTVLEASPARLEHARALVSLGGQLRRLGRRAEARDPLRRGLHLATLCGAPVVAERALLELRAAGGRPRKPTLTGIHALTATERRVADMAARGLSNREIAQALFVTTRTVEGHLTHAYQKLGITSRVELDMSLSGNSHRARHP